MEIEKPEIMITNLFGSHNLQGEREQKSSQVLDITQTRSYKDQQKKKNNH